MRARAGFARAMRCLPTGLRFPRFFEARPSKIGRAAYGQARKLRLTIEAYFPVCKGVAAVLSHERVWAAIDSLAARHALSASGLARRAGLDSTAFNRSKRRSADGRPRWPSTESLAKIMDATGSTLIEFFALVETMPAVTTITSLLAVSA